MSGELKIGGQVLAGEARELLVKAAKRQVQVEQRALEVFSQLLKIPQFQAWFEQHIILRDEVDHEKKTVTTFVIYKDDVTAETQNKEGKED